MTLDQIKQEAESFFGGKPVMIYRSDAVDFAQHCADKATAWRPIADAPKDGTPMLLCLLMPEREACKDDRRVYEGRWCAVQNAFTSVNGFILLNNATHWKPLPQPPGAA